MARFIAPTPRTRRLGRELKKLREGQSLKVGAAAKLLRCSASRVSRIESGEINAKPGDVMEFLVAYGTAIDSGHGQSLVELARDEHESGWWQRLNTLSSKYTTYVAYEAEAREVREFQPSLIPGLLQTEAYATAIISIRKIWVETDDETIRQRVDVRLTRQQLLSRPSRPLKLHVIISEAALKIEVGGPEVMREQLEHLVKSSRLPNVTIQVLRFSAGAYLATSEGFLVFTLDQGDPPLGYVESKGGELYLESPEDVKQLNSGYDHLRKLAMSPAESIKYIKEALT